SSGRCRNLSSLVLLGTLVGPFDAGHAALSTGTLLLAVSALARAALRVPPARSTAGPHVSAHRASAPLRAGRRAWPAGSCPRHRQAALPGAVPTRARVRK